MKKMNKKRKEIGDLRHKRNESSCQSSIESEKNVACRLKLLLECLQNINDKKTARKTKVSPFLDSF